MARVNLERERKNAYYWSEVGAQSMGDIGRLQAAAGEPERLPQEDFERTNALLKELLLRDPKVFVLAPSPKVSPDIVADFLPANNMPAWPRRSFLVLRRFSGKTLGM